MNEASNDVEEPYEPAPTWGSTVNVASGISSIQYNTQPTQIVNRVLQMQPSPGPATQSRRTERIEERSSPVEDFSSPAKPSQFTESDSIASQAPVAARVGTWELPTDAERIPAEIDMDPNGDDDLVRAQIGSIFAQEREAKRKRREEQAASSSLLSQGSTQAAQMNQNRMPQSFTPPPLLKRARRIQQQDERSRSEEAIVRSITRRAKEDEVDLSNIASPSDILADPTNEASRYAISQYIKASPLVPNFLKDEIKRYLDKSVQHSQSQASSSSDSDTQEDGYLKTKAFWLFELLRVEQNGNRIEGRALTSDVNRGSMTMVLQIDSNAFTYGVQFADRESLLMSRNEARSNPWFDGNGHPFNIIYRSSVSNQTSPSNGTSSIVTQPSAALISRLSQISEEKEIAERGRVEVEKRLEAMLASYHTTQEDNDFLRRQYGDASTMAAEMAKANTLLSEEIVELKRRLSDGMKTVKAFSESRISRLKEQLKVTQMQLDLLVQQNRLTNDSIREKAGKWDAYQAKEEVRIKEMERRRAEVDSLRAASYQAIQEDDLQRAADLRKKPHGLFLEVDLNTEKQALPGDHIVIDEEDEIAILRAEAEEATGQTIDISAPRSRRARSSRLATAAAAASSVVEPQRNIKEAIEEQSVQQGQLQALSEAAEMVEGELAYQTRGNLGVLIKKDK